MGRALWFQQSTMQCGKLLTGRKWLLFAPLELRAASEMPGAGFSVQLTTQPHGTLPGIPSS